jgi:hypothetical protein
MSAHECARRAPSAANATSVHSRPDNAGERPTGYSRKEYPVLIRSVSRCDQARRWERRSMRFLLVPFFMLATIVAHAEPSVISGMGTLGCSTLTAQTPPGSGYGQNNLTMAVFSWVQGYLSAWNVVGIMQSGRFADLTSITANEQWSGIVEFCQRNPDGFVLDAAREILATRLKMETGAPLNR